MIHQIVEFNSFLEFLEAKPPEGLHAKYDDLWQLCRDHPDVQAMLDEAVKGKQGERTDLKPNLLYNIQEVKPPSGTSRAAGLRKLRKYAEEKPEVAEVYQKVLSGEISVNKALLETGLRKTSVKAISPTARVEEVAAIISGWSLSDRTRLVELLGEILPQVSLKSVRG